MRLEAKFDIATSEQRLRELANVASNEPLRLPTKARYLTAGGEAALVQYIITWAQKTNPAFLQSYIVGVDDQQIGDLIGRFYGLSAILLANKISGVRSDIDLTKPLKAAALARLNLLQGSKRPSEAYRPQTVEIICADHIGGRATPYLLYQSPKPERRALRSRDNFRSLSSWLLGKTVPEAYIDQIDDELPPALGGMLYEVFKNTDRHALKDVNGDILSLSIRALKASYIGLLPKTLEQIAADFPPLGEYCKKLRPAAGAKQVHLFEISIIDSGPGFASSWTKQPLEALNDDEEEVAVRTCFLKHSSDEHDRFGKGLPHVIRLLRKEGGFMRLRTGRTSFFADFSDENGQQDGTSFLRRWQPEHSLPLGKAAGTVFTIILPLKRRAWPHR